MMPAEAGGVNYLQLNQEGDETAEYNSGQASERDNNRKPQLAAPFAGRKLQGAVNFLRRYVTRCVHEIRPRRQRDTRSTCSLGEIW